MANQTRKEMMRLLISSGVPQKKARKIMCEVKEVEANATPADIWVNEVLPAIKRNFHSANIVVA